MLEHQWKGWLAARGVPVPRGVFVAAPVTVDVGALEGLRPPLVVKALGPRIVHKTELGAVRVGLGTPRAAADAVAAMIGALTAAGVPVAGVLVEEMADAGVEVMLGVEHDAAFGRLLAFGVGGTRVEAQGEVDFFTLPLRRHDVDTVLATIPWLRPTLARTGGDGLRGLQDFIWRFAGPGGVALDAAVERLELNPVIVHRHGVVAVDARGEGGGC